MQLKNFSIKNNISIKKYVSKEVFLSIRLYASSNNEEQEAAAEFNVLL